MLEFFCSETLRHYSSTFKAFEAELKLRSDEQETRLNFDQLKELLKNVDGPINDKKGHTVPTIKLIEHMFANQERLFARIGEFEAIVLKRSSETIPHDFRKTVQKIEFANQ